VLIYVFNVLLLENISTKQSHQDQRHYTFKYELFLKVFSTYNFNSFITVYFKCTQCTLHQFIIAISIPITYE